LTFGPVPSRRLGQSLGINNIPPKVCSYSCVYCQLGRTKKMEIKPRYCYDPEEIFKEVQEKLNQAVIMGESVDYLTFVADGEPTLDIHLGRLIDLFKSLKRKIAVITNASLIRDDKVKENLNEADWVSVKIDSVQEEIWRRINRPHRSLDFHKILNGIREFAGQYKGRLVTETMVVRSLNDSEDHLKEAASFIGQLLPGTSYLSVPIRPPAEEYVKPPKEDKLVRLYQIFQSEIKEVEMLIGYEGNAFAFTGDAEKDLLSITAVHPMREDAVIEFLKKAQKEWSVIEKLVDKGMLVERDFQGNKFYIRKLITPVCGLSEVRME
jgi:wyosine [tRNA(Phe)-imidazoG37] synthetase (radical SAM superfamily)